MSERPEALSGSELADELTGSLCGRRGHEPGGRCDCRELVLMLLPNVEQHQAARNRAVAERINDLADVYDEAHWDPAVRTLLGSVIRDAAQIALHGHVVPRGDG